MVFCTGGSFFVSCTEEVLSLIRPASITFSGDQQSELLSSKISLKSLMFTSCTTDCSFVSKIMSVTSLAMDTETFHHLTFQNPVAETFRLSVQVIEGHNFCCYFSPDSFIFKFCNGTFSFMARLFISIFLADEGRSRFLMSHSSLDSLSFES